MQQYFDQKFKGVPPKRNGKNTDYARNRNYFTNICKTYEGLGLTPKRIERIFVIWSFADQDVITKLTEAYTKQHGFSVAVMSFRDEILPKLMEKIGTSNYEDEVLRTLSLLRQCDLQKLP